MGTRGRHEFGGDRPVRRPRVTGRTRPPGETLTTGPANGAGYTDDLFGRTTGLTVAGGAMASVGYYVNDMVVSQTQGSTSRSYALDPARRIRS